MANQTCHQRVPINIDAWSVANVLAAVARTVSGNHAAHATATARQDGSVDVWLFEDCAERDAFVAETVAEISTPSARLRRLHDQARRDAEELTNLGLGGLDNAGIFLRISEVIRRERERLDR